MMSKGRKSGWIHFKRENTPYFLGDCFHCELLGFYGITAWTGHFENINSPLFCLFEKGYENQTAMGFMTQIIFQKRLTKSCYPFNSRVSITNQSDVKTRQVYNRVPITTAFDMRPKDSARWWQPWTVLALISQSDGSSEDVRNHECGKARGDS